MKTNKFDEEARRLKSRRASIFAGVSLFLLALTWSINSFFLWLFLGFAATGAILVWYFQPPTAELREDEPSWQASRPSTVTPTTSPKSLILGLILFMVILLVAVIARLVFSAGSKPSSEVADSSQTAATIDSLTNKGNELYNSKDYDAAMVCYEAVLRLDEANEVALYDKALVLYAQEQYDQARRILLNCLAIKPDYKEAWWLLGDVYAYSDNADSTRICLDIAYENNLRDPEFLKLLAGAYEKTDKAKAIERYQEVLSQDSAQSEVYHKLSQLVPDEAGEYERLAQKWQNGNPSQ